MVIDNFNILRPGIDPAKTDPPLVVYSNAVLAAPATLQLFKLIARWRTQIIEFYRRLKGIEFSRGDFRHRLPTRFRPAGFEEKLGVLICEADDHRFRHTLRNA
jgi:hypothetical protein